MRRLERTVFASVASVAMVFALGLGAASASATSSTVGKSIKDTVGSLVSSSVSGSASGSAADASGSADSASGTTTGTGKTSGTSSKSGTSDGTVVEPSASDLVGTWSISGVEYNGMSMDIGSLGLDLSDVPTLTFAEGGTGTMSTGGASTDMEWKVSGNTVTVTAAGQTMDFTYEDGNLTVEQDGAALVFTRGEAAADSSSSSTSGSEDTTGMSADPTKIPGVWMIDSVGDSESTSDLSQYATAIMLTFNDDGTGTLAVSGTDICDFEWTAKGDSVEVILPGDSYSLTFDLTFKDGSLTFATAGTTISFSKSPLTASESGHAVSGGEGSSEALGDSSDLEVAPPASDAKIKAVTGDDYQTGVYTTILPEGWTADDSYVAYDNEIGYSRDSDGAMMAIDVYEDSTYTDDDVAESVSETVKNWNGVQGDDVTLGDTTYQTVTYSYYDTQYTTLYAAQSGRLVSITMGGVDLSDPEVAAIIANLKFAAASSY